jgi:hypothetical protein
MNKEGLTVGGVSAGGGGVPARAACTACWMGIVQLDGCLEFLLLWWCHGRMNYKDTEPYMSAFL